MPSPQIGNVASQIALRRYGMAILAKRHVHKVMLKERFKLNRRKGKAGHAPANDNPVPLDKDAELKLTEIFLTCSGPEEALDAARLAIAQAYPDKASEVLAEVPSQAPALYENRDRTKFKDPIAFLEATWGGIKGLYLDDLNRLDPKLAPAIRSYCQRMSYKDADGGDLLPKDILPPVRPDRGGPVTAEPGTVEHEVQRRRVLRRARDARHKEKIQEPSP